MISPAPVSTADDPAHARRKRTSFTAVKAAAESGWCRTRGFAARPNKLLIILPLIDFHRTKYLPIFRSAEPYRCMIRRKVCYGQHDRVESKPETKEFINYGGVPLQKKWVIKRVEI
jgi:hypothetical protein